MEYLRDTILFKLFSVQQRLVTAVHKDFDDVDITHQNYVTLHFIYENPGISQNELARLNSKDKNVIVKTLDRLEAEGFARRVQAKEDRRSYRLYVTEEGEVIIRKYWRRLVQRQEGELDCLSEKEKETLNGILEKILKSGEA